MYYLNDMSVALYYKSERSKAIRVAIQALKIVAKMKEHCEGSCTDCPYHNQNMDKCMNDLLKGE